MRKCFICMLSFMMVCVSRAEDITIRYIGSTAKVTQKAKDSVNVTLEGANVKAQSQGNDAVDANPACGFFPPSFTGGDGGGSPAIITIPFSMRQSATLVANPAFKLGSTYTLKTKDYEKTFTFSEPFTAFPFQFRRQ